MGIPARIGLFGALLTCAAAGLAQAVVAVKFGAPAAVALPLLAILAIVIWRQPIRGVQLALLAVPLESFVARFGGNVGLSPTESLLILTAGIWLVLVAIDRDTPWVPRTIWAMGGLCAAIIPGYFVATDTFVVTKILLVWIALTVVAVLVANQPREELRRTLLCLVISAGIAGAIAVANGQVQSFSSGGTVVSNRAQASFEQPNVLAFFLAISIPVGIVFAVSARRWVRLLALVCTGLALWGMMLTLSRTAFLGTGLALALLLVWRPFRRLALIGLAALSLFTLVNYEAVSRSREITIVSKRLATLTRSDSVGNDPRAVIYQTAPRIFLDHPLFGVGMANFSIASARYGLRDPEGHSYDHAHNVPLTIADEMGLIGLAALGWFCWEVGKLLLSGFRTRGDPDVGPLVLALTAAILAIVPSSIGDYPPRTNALAAPFLIELAILAALLAATAARRRTAA